MISVVIPAFNEEKFLPDCLLSLKNQDYEGEYEIIVADNGSSDSTADIALNFGAKVVAANGKRSAFYARQVGADAASGDIIIQADADTIYPRGWLKRIADQFASHPEVVAVAGRYTYRNSPWWAKVEYFCRHRINRLTTVLFGRPLVISGATFAFRRKAFLYVNGYRGLSYSPDQWGINGRLSKMGKILYDEDLRVLTSSRNVRKPLLIILLEGSINFTKWGVYLVKCCIGAVKGFSVKIPLKRVVTRLLPLSILVFSLILIIYGYFIPASPVFGKVYYEGHSKEKVVALTFDDGPNEPYTSQILNILVSDNIKATFFLIGKNVELYPETAKRILTDGDVIGNHSYSHTNNHALTEYGARDLKLAEKVISNITGVSPHLYRPPHGKKSPWELEAVKKDGMIEVTWSDFANDQPVFGHFGRVSPKELAGEIIENTKPGRIILLHDGYGTEHNDAKSDKSLTVKALPLIIKGLQAKGYRFVTVPELLKIPAYN